MSRRGLRGAGGFNLFRATLALVVLSATFFPPAAMADAPWLTAEINSPPAGMDYSYTSSDVRFVGNAPGADCANGPWHWDLTGTLADGSSYAYSTDGWSFDRALPMGDYAVTLTVAGACGITAQDTRSFHVLNYAPWPKFPVPQLVAGVATTLDGSGSTDDGGIVAYHWTLDGAPAGDGPTLTINDTRANDLHVVALTVTDALGASSTDTQYLGVDPGPVASVHVMPDWYDRLTVGSTVQLGAWGYDAWGNLATFSGYALAASCGAFDGSSWTLPTTAQDCTVTADGGGLHAERVYHVVAGPVTSTVITGPDSVVAGEPIAFHVDNFDAYGNVAYANDFTYTFTQARQELRFCSGDTCHPFTVVPAALATISLWGPVGQNVVVAGQEATLRAWGRDAYGNDVFNENVSWTAPTLAGAATATYERDGVTGTLAVQVVPDVATMLRLDGPDAIQAGAAATYTVVLLDQYANVVPATPPTWVVRPTTAGAQTIHARVYAQGAFHDLTHDVTVSAGPLASLSVTPERSPVNVGRPVQFRVQGADAFGNPVATGPVSWDAVYGGTVNATGVFAGTRAGTQTVRAQAGAVAAYGFVDVRDAFPVSIAMDAGRPALGHGPSGTIRAAYLDGAPVAGASVTVTFARALGPAQTITGATDAAGTLRFELPIDAALLHGWTASAHVSDGRNHGDETLSG